MSETRIGGRYRLDERLAAGGMGTVWKAYDERLHRVVAVKQLHMQPGLSRADAEVASQRAMREARLTARLHHPNAVQVYDVVDHDDRPCLVMQYVPSRSLQQVVSQDGPLAPDQVARIGTQVSAALAAAHRAGIVHRDVKPGNVLIGHDGVAQITDFGISHAFDDATLTSTGLVTGTPAYLAPEVARGGESTFASDVYSLGATLYMALEGAPPFAPDTNPMAVLHRAASGEAIVPTRGGPLVDTVRSLTATDPARRPPMVEIAPMLSDVTRRLAAAPGPVTAATTVLPSRPSGPPPGPVRPAPADRTAAFAVSAPAGYGAPDERRDRVERGGLPWLIIAAGVVALLVVVLLGFVLLHNTGDQSGGSTAAGGSSTQAGTSAAPTKRRASTRPSATRTRTRTRTSKPVAPPPQTSPSSSPSPSPVSSAPSTSTSTSAGGQGAPSADQLAQAIVDYYSIVPGNLDEGWSRLTPSFQQNTAGGRGTYNAFWGSIERVDVAGAGGQSPGTASATLTYHYKNGRVVTERTTFGLVRQGGVLKINTSQSG